MGHIWNIGRQKKQEGWDGAGGIQSCEAWSCAQEFPHHSQQIFKKAVICRSTELLDKDIVTGLTLQWDESGAQLETNLESMRTKSGFTISCSLSSFQVYYKECLLATKKTPQIKLKGAENSEDS